MGAAYAANGDSADASANAISGQAVAKQLQLGVDYLNQHGGLGGCQVKPIYFPFYTSQDWTTQTQDECTNFTQDNHVIAIIPTAEELPDLWSCAAKKGVVVPADTGFSSSDGFSLATYRTLRGTLVDSNDLPLDRWSFVPSAFERAGYFDPGAKVAIVYTNTPDQTFLVNQVLKPAFAAVGHPVFDSVAVPLETGYQTFGPAQSQCQSAFLRFRGEGATDIVFTSAQGPFDCETNAEAQQWFPRYGYTTYSMATPPLEPTAQQNRAVLVAWMEPFISTTATTAATGNPARDRCNKIFAGQPQNVSLTSIYVYCDALFELQAGYAHATNMTDGAFLAGYEALGTSFRTSNEVGPNAQLGANRDWGAAYYALGGWNATAQAFQLQGVTQPIP